MKTINTKRILACLLLGASYILTNAQGIVVYKTDGTQIKVPYEQLDSIATYTADDGPIIPVDPTVLPVTIQDLMYSEWEDGGLGFSQDYSLVFTADQVTVKQGDEVTYQGAYTLENNVVSFVMDGTTYQSMPGLAGGQSVLIMKEVYNDGHENFAFAVVQKGKTISTKKEDIQGQWIWWEEFEVDEGEIERYARIAYKFEGDNFDLIITPWGQRYTGTYTYENGILLLNIQNGYTSREEGTGYGWGEGELDPVTLIGNWKTLYPEHWSFETMEGPFFVIGNEAFAALLMPCICTKNLPTR